MPIVYNVSDKSLHEAESQFLYDFSAFYEIILNPGEIRKVSARTIQGFTQYIISEYQQKDYAGIYAFVPASAVIDGTKLKDEILLVSVLEAPITAITVKSFDPEQNEKDENIYLQHSVVQQWSPV